jgi:hypothetical protein
LAVLLQQLLLVSATPRVKARRRYCVLAAAAVGLAAVLLALVWLLLAVAG